MCVVSNIGDYGRTMWPPVSTPTLLSGYTPWASGPSRTIVTPPYTGPTKEQFDELLILLRAGVRFDKATGQAHCEQEQKIGWLRDIAKTLGVDPVKVDEALKG